MTIKRRKLLTKEKLKLKNVLDQMTEEKKIEEEKLSLHLAEKSPTKTSGTGPFRKNARLDGWILFLLMAY